LRWWWVGVCAVAVVSVGTGVGWWLWTQSQGVALPALVQARADAIRTGITAAGGTGAALALLLAVRRQRSTDAALELQDADLAHKERMAADARHDATERRITDLYAKAVEQLGSDRAPVRLGGLYALERLAQTDPSDDLAHRRTVVEVICAYLRMPYAPIEHRSNDTGSNPREQNTKLAKPDVEVWQQESTGQQNADHREQELQVRLAAQRILTSHLRPEPNKDGQPTNPKYWTDISLDLTGAYLVDFNLSHCQAKTVTFNHATFVGETLFRGATFSMAFIQGATFVHGPDHDTFVADFRGARFISDVWFSFTTFARAPWFHADEFFPGAYFGRYASFKGATFSGGARFDGASFEGGIDFDEARTNIYTQNKWPKGWTEYPADDNIGRQLADTEGRWTHLVHTETN
jgi:hypothetical protein